MTVLAAALAGLFGAGLAALVLGVRPPARAPRPRRPSRIEQRELWLRQAGAGLSARQFYGGSAATGLVVFVLLAVVVGAWAIALVPALLAAGAPHAWYAQQRRTRLGAVVAAWPDGLRDLAAAVSARIPLHQALVGLATSGPAPLREAFAAFPVTARTSGVVPALERVKSELADPTSDRVLEVLILASDRGQQALASVLQDLADATQRDLRTAEEIETARAEPRLNMRITAALPWLVLTLLVLSDGPHRDFYSRGLGVVIVLASAAFTATGVLLVRVLARDPVEPRVLAESEHG